MKAAQIHRCRSGAITAEFALMLPVLLIFLLGIIDAGRFMWTWNTAEKATQMGVRFAAATEAVETGLASYDFYTSAAVPRGDPIPEATFGGAVVCTSSGCTCGAGANWCLGTLSQTAFDNTVARMQAIMPQVTGANVTIEYTYSGIGYSGDPYGPDVNPLITVRLSGLALTPALFNLFGASLTLPAFDSTLSMEDGTGAISN